MPGIKNEWLKMYFPILVVPVSSISTAATTVGYVGSRNSAEAAAKHPTRTDAGSPRAAATGMNVTVVAACE